MSCDENTSTVQVKMRPMLSDMPPKVKQMIAERTDVKSRYCLRKVNTHFRAAVDESPYNVCVLWIRRYSNRVKTLCGRVEIEYEKHGENGCVIRRSDTTETIIEGEDFMQRAIDDLAIILKSPKVFVKIFRLKNFGSGAKGAEQLLAKLRTFRHQLNIGVLNVDGKYSQDDVVQLLGHVTPRTLKTLDIYSTMASDIRVDRIADTEQWRHLKGAMGGKVEGVPIAKIMHLEYFQPTRFKLTEPIIEEIVQWVRQHRDMAIKYRFNSVRNRRTVRKWQNAVSQYQPSRKRIRIPGTERYLEIKLKSIGATFKTTGVSVRNPEDSDYSLCTDDDYEENGDSDASSQSELSYDLSATTESDDYYGSSESSFDSDDSDEENDDGPQEANIADNGIPNVSAEPDEYDASDESNASDNED